MVTFKYSPVSKIIFRYANIPVTFFLLLYLASSFIYMFKQWVYVFPVLLNLGIIVVLNRYYFRSHKLFPFRIDINTEKMICSDFYKKNKIVEINLRDIDYIEGGALSGTPAKPILLHDVKNDVVIGISTHLKNYNKLITIILSNVPRFVYDDVLTRVQEMNKEARSFFSSKGKKKPIKK